MVRFGQADGSLFIFCCLKRCATGTIATGPLLGVGSAVVGREMTTGVHCAHFTIRRASGTSHSPPVGVVGPSFDPSRTQRGSHSPYGWMLNTSTGHLGHDSRGTKWDGQPGEFEIKSGSVIVRSATKLVAAAAKGIVAARRLWCWTWARAPWTCMPTVGDTAGW